MDLIDFILHHDRESDRQVEQDAMSDDDNLVKRLNSQQIVEPLYNQMDNIID